MIEFDPAKEARNRAKHGIGLGEFVDMDQTVALVQLVDRDGERRQVIVAPIHGRLHVAVITVRGANTRVISLRKANRREERLYAKTTQG